MSRHSARLLIVDPDPSSIERFTSAFSREDYYLVTCGTFDEAVDLVRRKGRASISMLQQRLRIGYTRSARIVEMMEAKGIIGPPQGGAHHREILDYGGIAGPPVGE